MYPYPVGKGLALWEMAYNTPDIQGQMNALDACIQAAYTGGVFESRLDRTFVKQYNEVYHDILDTGRRFDMIFVLFKGIL